MMYCVDKLSVFYRVWFKAKGIKHDQVLVKKCISLGPAPDLPIENLWRGGSEICLFYTHPRHTEVWKLFHPPFTEESKPQRGLLMCKFAELVNGGNRTQTQNPKLPEPRPWFMWSFLKICIY